MKISSFISFILFFIVVFISCADEESKFNFEEQLIGDWQGDIEQPGFGTLVIQLKIRSSQANVLTGSWTTTDKDNTFSCIGTLEYEGQAGQSILLDLSLSSGPCLDNSVATINRIDENTIEYSNTDDDNTTTITGIMTRQ